MCIVQMEGVFPRNLMITLRVSSLLFGWTLPRQNFQFQSRDPLKISRFNAFGRGLPFLFVTDIYYLLLVLFLQQNLSAVRFKSAQLTIFIFKVKVNVNKSK